MKKHNFGILSILLASVIAFTSCGNKSEEEVSKSKILINEVLMSNETNFQDDYGMHSAWVELFNKSYGNVNIAGYRLKYSDAAGDTMTYVIPKGDVLTLIPPRQHSLFWADGQPNRGTFHVNFVLNPERNVWLGLYDSGDKFLDEITIPAGTLTTDQSYALIVDGEKTAKVSKCWEVKGAGTEKYVTPSTNNFTLNRNAKMENFTEKDPVGIGMAISAMVVVFSCLLILYIVFKNIGKISAWWALRTAGKAKGLSEEEVKESMAKGSTPGEVFAAIAMAMHEMQEDVHDVEDTILTISNVQRRYSPWNSKIYTLRDIPKK